MNIYTINNLLINQFLNSFYFLFMLKQITTRSHLIALIRWAQDKNLRFTSLIARINHIEKSSIYVQQRTCFYYFPSPLGPQCRVPIAHAHSCAKYSGRAVFIDVDVVRREPPYYRVDKVVISRHAFPVGGYGFNSV